MLINNTKHHGNVWSRAHNASVIRRKRNSLHKYRFHKYSWRYEDFPNTCGNFLIIQKFNSYITLLRNDIVSICYVRNRVCFFQFYPNFQRLLFGQYVFHLVDPGLVSSHHISRWFQKLTLYNFSMISVTNCLSLVLLWVTLTLNVENNATESILREYCGFTSSTNRLPVLIV